MPSRRNEEVLTPRRGNKAFEPIVVVRHLMRLHEIERCLIAPHPRKEVSGWHEDSELKLRLVRLVWDIERIEAGTIHADVDRRAVGRA